MTMLKNAFKYLVNVFSMFIGTFIVSLCLIYLLVFDTLQGKMIAIAITFGGVYAIILLLNKFLPGKISVLHGVFEILSGPLMIIGVISCLSLIEFWPMKIIGMLVWIGAKLFVSSVISRNNT